MKKFLCIGLSVFIFLLLFGENELIKKGDLCFERRNEFLDLREATKNINEAIEIYSGILDKNFDEIVFYKLVKAIDFKYSFLLDKEENKVERVNYCKSLLEKIDNYCKMNKNEGISVYILYSKAILGKILISSLDKKDSKLLLIDIAKKIKESAEKLVLLDEKFESYVAYLVLGRLYYEAPKIVFILPWPNKYKSKEYLQRYLLHNPDSLVGLYFLADTLYSLGQKEEARKLYLKVAGSKVRENFYYEDKRIIEEVQNNIKNFY